MEASIGRGKKIQHCPRLVIESETKSQYRKSNSACRTFSKSTSASKLVARNPYRGYGTCDKAIPDPPVHRPYQTTSSFSLENEDQPLSSCHMNDSLSDSGYFDSPESPVKTTRNKEAWENIITPVSGLRTRLRGRPSFLDTTSATKRKMFGTSNQLLALVVLLSFFVLILLFLTINLILNLRPISTLREDPDDPKFRGIKVEYTDDPKFRSSLNVDYPDDPQFRSPLNVDYPDDPQFRGINSDYPEDPNFRSSFNIDYPNDPQFRGMSLDYPEDPKFRLSLDVDYPDDPQFRGLGPRQRIGSQEVKYNKVDGKTDLESNEIYKFKIEQASHVDGSENLDKEEKEISKMKMLEENDFIRQKMLIERDNHRKKHLEERVKTIKNRQQREEI